MPITALQTVQSQIITRLSETKSDQGLNCLSHILVYACTLLTPSLLIATRLHMQTVWIQMRRRVTRRFI